MESGDIEIAAPVDSIHSSYKQAYNTLKDHGLKNSYSFLLQHSWLYYSETKMHYYYYYNRYWKYKSIATVSKTSI